MNRELARQDVPDAGHRAKLRVIVGATGLFGLFPLSLSPLIVSAAQNQGLSPVEAGILASCLLTGVSATAIGLGAVSDRLSLRRVFTAGLLVVVAAQAAMLATGASSFAALCLLWLVSGFGSGCGVVVGDVMLAKTRNPMMTAGQALAITSFLMLCVFPLGTYLIDAIGPSTMSILSIGSALGAFALVRGLDLDGLAGSRRITQRTGQVLFTPPAIALAVAIAFFWIRDGMIWSFSASNAERLGIAPADVGLVLGAAGVCGVLGCCASAWVARSGAVSRGFALLAGLATATVAALWTMSAEPRGFAALQLSYNALQLFTYPFLLGFAAQLDRTGRLAAIAGGMTLLGAAIGPIAAGVAVEGWGSSGLAVGVSLVSLVSVIAFVRATARGRARVSLSVG
ncbi:MAG TPA: MFS transporter [Allosphingosinicella sp.]|jgi:predicted MFS family arabinose efflux permease